MGYSIHSFTLYPFMLLHPQWNISDYFFQRGEAITQELEREEEALQKQAQEKGEILNRPFHPAPPFDCLWLCLYAKLGELCVDPRPAVRKSAGQTLFSTIAAHGTLLQQQTWHIVIWKVPSNSFLSFYKISFYSRFSLFASISFLHLHLSPLGIVPPARLCEKVVHHSR